MTGLILVQSACVPIHSMSGCTMVQGEKGRRKTKEEEEGGQTIAYDGGRAMRRWRGPLKD